MPVSRLLVRPDAEPVRRLAPADRIGLSVISGELGGGVPGHVSAGLGLSLGAEPAMRSGDPAAGATATPPVATHAPLTAVPAGSALEGSATVVGPLGPVRAARWNAQPVSAAGVAAGPGSSPKADATSS